VSATEERLPPHSNEAERAVIGSMLRHNPVIGDLVQIIKAEAFYHAAHQSIFRAILELYEAGKPVDMVTVADLLHGKREMENIGGYSYIANLWEAQPTAANAIYYANIVRDKAVTRQVINTAVEITRDGQAECMPGEALLESAEGKFLAIAEGQVVDRTITLPDAIHQAGMRLDEIQGGERATGLKTGLIDLDAMTGGAQESELVLIAARTSSGKTALALQVARHVAIEEQRPVLFVSMEQSGRELAERLLAAEASVDSRKIRDGSLSPEEFERFVRAGRELGKGKLFIDESPKRTVLQIGANARRYKARENIGLLVVDYVGLVEPDNPRDPRHIQVGTVSRRLKQLARELRIPVIALCQLNRMSEERANHKPRLSDLRESGSLEQDADVVYLLYRPEVFAEKGKEDADSRPGEVDLIVAKNRNGRTGEITLTFQKEFMRFENFAPVFRPYAKRYT
jgi:replicative DNA helicase